MRGLVRFFSGSQAVGRAGIQKIPMVGCPLSYAEQCDPHSGLPSWVLSMPMPPCCEGPCMVVISQMVVKHQDALPIWLKNKAKGSPRVPLLLEFWGFFYKNSGFDICKF